MGKLMKKIIISSIVLISISIFINYNYSLNYYQELPNSSGFWATLDLYDPMSINNTRLQTNSVINIQGRLYNLFNGSGKSGYTVIINVDGTPDSSFNDITDGNGDFSIAYTVDPFLDLYTSHIIDVIVDNPTPPGNIDYTSYFSIDVSTSSYFELNEPLQTKLLGENIEFEGYLRYENGNGIPFESLNYYWYDGLNLVDSGTVSTNSQGEINDIYIPDWAGEDLTLKFNYTNLPYVSYSESFLTNTKLFSVITCSWDLPDTIYEDREFRIQGQLLSLNNPSLTIGSRTIRIYYNYSFLTTITTDPDGNFDYSYQLSNGTGTAHLGVELDGPSGTLSTGQFIDIQVAPPPPPPPTPPEFPFLAFFSIFIPIAVGIAIGLAVYGFYRYKKSEKESRVVNLPLEDRILNLKLLKESGRLEESLSYLFNAIYMDLIKAKYGRIRKDTETIRDFAIISVTQLNLSPTSIYPFIQKVEEIIYAKPFQITEKEFYSTIELFSPIYLELTGYNFVLNI